MVWEGEELFQAGMAGVQEARSQDPDRNRPAPTSVERFEILRHGRRRVRGSPACPVRRDRVPPCGTFGLGVSLQ